jgi:hypothetical protein
MNVYPFRRKPKASIGSNDQCQHCSEYADMKCQLEFSRLVISRLRRDNIDLSKQLSAADAALFRDVITRAKFDEESS